MLPDSSLKLISVLSKCIEFLIDYIFVMFGRHVFLQTTYLWIQTVFLFSLICCFVRMRQTSYRGSSRKTKRFNFMFCCWSYLSHWASNKDTTNTARSASYLKLHLEIDNESQLRTKLYDKKDDFNFPIGNFPFICRNIPASFANEIYIAQLIQYSRACGSCQVFLDRRLLLTKKLLN